MQWDHVRVFLAVARAGQMLAAARSLGVNHATVGRQITALEESLQTMLIERHTGGCMLTPAGEAMFATAERIESELLRFDSAVCGDTKGLRGTVRVGAPDGLGNYFLAPTLAELSGKHPELLVQLVALPRSFSLPRREADLVITLDRPIQGDLIVQKLGDYTMSLYASREYLLASPPLTTVDELKNHRLITYSEEAMHTAALDYGRKLANHMPTRFECGSMVGQIEATRAGEGVAILLDYPARQIDSLVRILSDVQVLGAYWLMSHPDTHRSYRVAEVRRHIVEAFRRSKDDFCPSGAHAGILL